MEFCIFFVFVGHISKRKENIMELSIREHIINNFKGDDYDALRSAIEESISEQDEVTLPGMGVFLEIIWNGADEEMKKKMIEIIKERVQNQEK